jgi:hypothetical protein
MVIVAELIEAIAPRVAGRIEAICEEPASSSTPELRSASAQAHRMLSYLARGQDRAPNAA